MEQVQKIILPNGIVLLYEHIEHIRSILLGTWVSRGSRHESSQEQGLAHFLEHMLFKGSSRRNSKEIAHSLEAVGGDINGFTSRDNCCYYAKATMDHVELVFDVISDLVLHPKLLEEEMLREKQVICQEIDMVNDSHEELVHDTVLRALYEEPLAHPVIGTKESVQSFSHEQLIGFYKKFYHPENLFITIVGNLDSVDVETLAMQYFHKTYNVEDELSSLPNKDRDEIQNLAIHKSTEQCHSIFAWRSFPIDHPDRYVLHLINAHLGGGMSSVLFQELREDAGLVYNTYSFIRAYSDTGFFGVYCGYHPQSASELTQRLSALMQKFVSEGLEGTRLQQLKEQLKGSLLLGLEKTSFRMNRMSVGHMHFQRIISTDELIEMVNSIQVSDINRVSKEIFNGPVGCINVGPLEQEEWDQLTQGAFQ